ncbi:chemotaxis protein CheA [Paenibacillus ihuae]|uniref:chemotaxis protein CheA n=1 Tax=Paenibacillus ihuae TaxID=1232431 RepID=UPI001ADF540F|nr:chemotaxis protein CheA [Paenibacillus ihuae]
MDVYMEEADEQILIMEEKMLLLEQGNCDSETIQSLFRAAHTLKGSSAAMGFDRIKNVTHEMESLLDLIRNKQLNVEPELVELLIDSLDIIRSLKEDLYSGTSETSDREIVARITHFRNYVSPPASSAAGTAEAADKNDQDIMPQLPISLDEQYRCLEARDQGKASLEVVISLEPDCLMKAARASIIYHRIADLAEIVRMSPQLERGAPEQNEQVFQELQFLIIADIQADELQRKLASLVEVAEVRIQTLYIDEPEEAAAASAKETGNDVSPSVEPPVTADIVAPHQAPAQEKKKTRSIRVDVDRLEHLMNLVGELLIDQVGIKQAGQLLNQRYRGDETCSKLAGQNDHLGRVIHELQEQVMKIRMLPAEQLFSRLPRIVRDLSKQLGKDVDLQLIGGETEMDRTVIEEITDPLIHLLRNGVDHGIESEAERVQKGKPPKGTLTIQASHEGNQVVIRVMDDGNGIDPERIRQSAVKKQIISEEAAAKLSDREAIQLIFKPGFSMAAVVSDISGRGVGMDIVRDHIEKLNGVIDIQSEVGKGTEFRIRLPLTLAIISGLQIKVNGTSFVLPMSNVLGIIRMKPEEIGYIRKQPVINLRGEFLPVASMQEVLGWDNPAKERAYQQVVIVGLAEKRIALLVDELHGNADIVVKSIGKYAGKIKCVTGATIMGDGRIALIFDISSLF